MTKTLNHYNKRHKKHRNKTQRKKKQGGSHAAKFYPGQVYNFDSKSKNLDQLKALMELDMPLVVRHYRNSCPHCKTFEPSWKTIEDSIHGNPSYSVASLDDYATDYINQKYYSPHGYHVNGVPTVVLIDSNRVPKEHVGPNTLKDINKFLNQHGLKLKIVPEDEDSSEEEEEEEGEEEYEESQEEERQEQEEAPHPEYDITSTHLDEPVSAPVSVPESMSAPESVSAPEPSDSVLSNMRQTVSKIDNNIKGGLDKVSEAFTNPIDLNNLFAAPVPAPASEAVPAPAPAPVPGVAAPIPDADAFPPAPAVDANGNEVPANYNTGIGNIGTRGPQVPSNIGGRRKKTRRGKKASSSRSRQTKHKRTKRTKRS